MDSRLTISGEIAGAPLNSSLSRSADGAIRHGPITLPAAEAGDLSTRTTDTTGVLTIAGTALLIGDTIDLYWDGGRRYDVDVDNVVGDDVTFSGGAGDILPAVSTAITAAEQVVIATDFDGANLVAVGALCTARGHLSFQETGVTELSVDLNSREAWFWLDQSTAPNPLVSTVVGAIKASHAGSAAAATLDLGVLYDSTP
ncbi:MAG: hypothetical protein IT430_19175 [Phycisphaerales bacterium]|nr:hypothetical protein [Phycisphaerales bacterium]